MKLVSLISGGIDSPVAVYLMSRRNCEITLLHMDNGSFGDSKELDKVKKLKAQLEKMTGKEFPLYVANHENSQKSIMDSCDRNYQCVMCKRVMQRVAKKFASENGFDAVLMGDSLGQVASQTLKNIKGENIGLDFPILRPLIGMDKLEIIKIAEEIGTFSISSEKTGGCSAVPIKPITESNPEKIKTFDESLDIDKIVDVSFQSIVRLRGGNAGQESISSSS